jgi:sterol 3beta-glucosyltransferase
MGLLEQRKAMRGVPIFDQMQQEVWDACQETDAVIYHPGLIAASFVANQRGIPAFMASPFPMTPTGAWPSLLFYDGPRLGSLYNRLTHTLFEQMFWQMFRAPIQKFWKARGENISSGAPYGRLRREGVPVLYGFSDHVLPRPADWPTAHHVTGYWFLDAAPAWQPPAALVDFLRTGPPPVYVGFGSVGSPRRAQETTALIVEALALAGQRGVLLTAGNAAEPGTLPETIFSLREAPHAWLFPQMAAIVHHGGAGTTAAGLRAGVPAVVVPHAVDQPMWGRRIAELGAGPQPIPRKQLTAEALAAAISAALHGDVRARADALGRRIRAEDGVAKAVEIIDHSLRGTT